METISLNPVCEILTQILGREVEALLVVFLHRKDRSLSSPGSSPDVMLRSYMQLDYCVLIPTVCNNFRSPGSCQDCCNTTTTWG